MYTKISQIRFYIRTGHVLVAGHVLYHDCLSFRRFVTMLDPLQLKYGDNLGALFYIPAFSGEVGDLIAVTTSLSLFLYKHNIYEYKKIIIFLINICEH